MAAPANAVLNAELRWGEPIIPAPPPGWKL
jgi:hypothetical protein